MTRKKVTIQFTSCKDCWYVSTNYSGLPFTEVCAHQDVRGQELLKNDCAYTGEIPHWCPLEDADD